MCRSSSPARPAPARTSWRARCTMRPLRSDQSFYELNCAGLPDDVLKLELLGAKKGALPGQPNTKIGLLQKAARGTLFPERCRYAQPADAVGVAARGDRGQFRTHRRDGDADHEHTADHRQSQRSVCRRGRRRLPVGPLLCDFHHRTVSAAPAGKDGGSRHPVAPTSLAIWQANIRSPLRVCRNSRWNFWAITTGRATCPS